MSHSTVCCIANKKKCTGGNTLTTDRTACQPTQVPQAHSRPCSWAGCTLERRSGANVTLLNKSKDNACSCACVRVRVFVWVFSCVCVCASQHGKYSTCDFCDRTRRTRRKKEAQVAISPPSRPCHPGPGSGQGLPGTAHCDTLHGCLQTHSARHGACAAFSSKLVRWSKAIEAQVFSSLRLGDSPFSFEAAT